MTRPQKLLILGVILATLSFTVIGIILRPGRSKVFITTEFCPQGAHWLTYPVWVGILPSAHEWSDRLKEGAQRWNEAAGADVIFVDDIEPWLVDNLIDMEVESGIVFVSLEEDITKINTNEYGITNIRITNDTCLIQQAHVRLFARTPQQHRRQVAIHELGHVLGYGDDYFDPTSVMYFQGHWAAKDIPPRIVDALRSQIGTGGALQDAHIK